MIGLCKVGYVQHDFVHAHQFLNKKFVRVIDLYSQNDGDEDRRRKYYTNYGFAVAEVL
jgi:hypothetical protein